jgi:hypothetical protein
MMKKLGHLFIFSVIILVFSCTFFSDLVDPEEHSSVTYSGRVISRLYRDSIIALSNVKVTIDGQSETTDKNGAFLLIGVSTGKYTLKLEKDGYVTKEKKITVKLENSAMDYTLYLENKLPVIDTFMAVPNNLPALNDPMTLIFSASDPMHHDLLKVIIEYGDGADTAFYYNELKLSDTVIHFYNSPGEFIPQLKAWNKGGDSTVKNVPVTISPKYRPTLSMTEADPTFNINPNSPGKMGRLKINCNDSDGLLLSLTINWGDGSSDAYSFPGSTYSKIVSMPHSYVDSGTIFIESELCDKDFLCRSDTLPIRIILLPAPKVQPLEFTEGQNYAIIARTTVQTANRDTIMQYIWKLNGKDVFKSPYSPVPVPDSGLSISQTLLSYDPDINVVSFNVRDKESMDTTVIGTIPLDLINPIE